MKSAIEKALDNIGKLNIQKLEEPKKLKNKKDNDVPIPVYDPRPMLYLNEKDLSTISKYKAGDKVVIVCECTVKSTAAYDRLEGKETKKAYNCDLLIEAIADITR